MTRRVNGVGGVYPSEGKFVSWQPNLYPTSGTGISGADYSGSRYTVYNGFLYGYFNMYIPSTSNMGDVDNHWNLDLPLALKGSSAYMLIGTGYISKPDNVANSYKLEICTFPNILGVAAVVPIITFYNSAFDSANDPNNNYEAWMGNTPTQARTEATRDEWLMLAKSWNYDTQRSLYLSAFLRYPVNA